MQREGQVVTVPYVVNVIFASDGTTAVTAVVRSLPCANSSQVRRISKEGALCPDCSQTLCKRTQAAVLKRAKLTDDFNFSMLALEALMLGDRNKFQAILQASNKGWAKHGLTDEERGLRLRRAIEVEKSTAKRHPGFFTMFAQERLKHLSSICEQVSNERHRTMIASVPGLAQLIPQIADSGVDGRLKAAAVKMILNGDFQKRNAALHGFVASYVHYMMSRNKKVLELEGRPRSESTKQQWISYSWRALSGRIPLLNS